MSDKLVNESGSRNRLRRIPPTAVLLVGIAAIFLACSCGGGGSNGKVAANQSGAPASQATSAFTVLGYNDLGMHCLNNDFSEMCILPPANNLRATVIRRGEDPQIVTSGVTVTYSIPGNSTSYKKINLWDYSLPLFGVALPKDVGLFGYGMSGTMASTPDHDFMARAIPITPITDSGQTDPYQLSRINVLQGSKVVATTQAVIPVSWEMSCNNCHKTKGMSLAMDILTKHDRLNGTHLVNQKPVLCAKCHADPALGAPGVAGVKTLSAAMHGFHASKFRGQTVEQTCYSCHPGPKTQCLRDIHKAKGLNCNSCHTSMEAVGNPARKPWVDEPRCGSCHHVAGHEYEQPGVLFRDSVGHHKVKCIACHGSPHAITPSTNPRDNIQSIALQGVAGPIGKKCSVCHTRTPEGRFTHNSRGD